MKVLVIGDTHGISDFSYLDEASSQADLIIHVGDLSDFGYLLRESLQGLSAYAKEINKPIVVTHGNHETRVLREIIDEYPELTYVHESVWVHQNLAIFGYGGGGFGKIEPQVEEFFERAYADRSHADKLHVWVFHGPPHDLEIDYRPDWGPTGSHTKRELVDKFKPHFVFAGHIHQAWGTVHEHENTLLVNPGPEGILLDISEK